MVLEPDSVGERFVLAPKVDRRTKSGKEEYKQFEQMAQGKTVVSFEDFDTATAMTQKILDHPFASKLLSGVKEQSFFWVDDLTGEECKCRSDCLTEVGKNLVVVDLKTTDNAETDAFMRSAVKYGYDFQAAMYSEGIRVNTGRKVLFVFIVIEKKLPYAINIMQADELFIRRGHDMFRELIGIYHDCKKTGNWYGYLGKFNQINNLSLPNYLTKEIE